MLKFYIEIQYNPFSSQNILKVLPQVSLFQLLVETITLTSKQYPQNLTLKLNLMIPELCLNIPYMEIIQAIYVQLNTSTESSIFKVIDFSPQQKIYTSTQIARYIVIDINMTYRLQNPIETQAGHRNQQILGFCIDSTCKNQRPYCNFCLSRHDGHLNKLTSQEIFNKWIQQRILSAQSVQKNVQGCKLAFDCLLNFLIPYSNLNIESFSEIGLSQMDNMIKVLCQVESCEDTLFKKLNQSMEQIKFIIDEILKKFVNSNSNRKLLISEQQKHLRISKANLNPFTFELLNQNSIQQNQRCCANAFSKDYSIVLAGCCKQIKVFQHLLGKLNQIQLLSEHQNTVETLNFMKQKNNFVSRSEDKTIIIWQAIGHNQWNCQQKLNGHSERIYCLLLNNTDDRIISGSFDKTIKFWMKQNSWSCQQTITDHTDRVYSLSLNEEQNKLISCSFDQQILVIEQSQLNKQWSVIQKIKIDQFGLSLCFINDNLFTFQPYSKQQMYVYEIDSNNKQYMKTKQIAVKCGSNQCDCLFQQQYLKSKCLLVNKNGGNVNLIRKKENDDFIIQQSIELIQIIFMDNQVMTESI